MKKRLLSVYLLSIVSYFGYSQSLSLSHDGNPVANNSDVIFIGEPTTSMIEAHMSVTNNGSVTIGVKVKKVEISLVDSSVNTFCWDVCYPPFVYVSGDTMEVHPAGTNSAFVGEYQPNGHAGESIIRYVFFDYENTDDSVCFNAIFRAYPLGIEDPSFRATLSNAYPNPANTRATFNYTVDAGARAMLIVRNVLGSTVKEIQLAGNGQVRIPTIELSEGIYFYSLVVNGQIQSTRKLVVSH